MSNRDRKRADRRKRKQRSSAQGDATASSVNREAEPELAASGDADAEPSVMEMAAEADARGVSKSELRNQLAREELAPLAPDERPRVVTVGAVISLLIAASIVISWLAGVKVRVGNTDISQQPNAFQVFPPAILFGVMGYGMLRTRYWAVLGFQAVMAIIMIGAFITLIAATSIFQAISTFLVLIGAGTLFWFTVKALARIQMPELDRDR